MNLRVLVGLVLLIGGVGALWMLWPRAETAPPDRAIAGQRVAAPTAGSTASDGGVAFRAPDVVKPLPKRVAPGLERPARRDEGVRMATPAHDYTQEYEPTVSSVEEGVLARAHRIRACTDVHGVPKVPPAFPVEEEAELDDSIAVLVTLDDGVEDRGQLDLLINGAPPGLTSCLAEAVGDMDVRSPGGSSLSTQLLIPLDGA